MNQVNSGKKRTTTATKSPQATADAKRTLDRIEDALAPIIEEMRIVIRDQVENNLRAWREIGLIFLQNRQAIEDARFMGNSGRINPFDIFAREVGCDERKLRHCAHFAERFDDELMEMAIAARLNWSHIVLLVTLPTRESCVSYIEKIVENRWTGNDLANALMQLFGNRREGSGRRNAVPRSLSSGLAKTLKSTAQFRRMMEQALFCDEFHVAEAVFTEPPDEISEMTSQQLRAAIQSMEAIITTLVENIPKLRDAAEHVDQRLAERKKCQPGDEARVGVGSRR